MSMYYRQFMSLFLSHSNYSIKVDSEHPMVIASKKINWDALIEEITPVIYKGINRYLGRRLDIRAHCGLFLLQSAYNWTDREAEDMLKNHLPTRIFCGLADSIKRGIDHTRIEKFRNRRLGKKGAEILNKYLLLLGKKQGHTDGKNVDMDTTVQEAGITYPTEMKLLKKFQERALKILGQIYGQGKKKTKKVTKKIIETKEKIKEYQFFAKAKERKKELISEVTNISMEILNELIEAVISSKEEVEKLRPFLKKELNHLLKIMPILFNQIRSWVKTGEVAKDKIISLYKSAPHFIKKGKIGKATEIGRKIIINQYTGGFLSVMVPENPVISDYDCVLPSLINTINIFSEIPESYGTDRGMDSMTNINLCKDWQIRNIGIQPKGKKEWEVDREMAQKLYCRRAAIEPRIGICGKLGLKKSRAKTDEGDIITVHRAAVGFNLKKLMTLWA